MDDFKTFLTTHLGLNETLSPVYLASFCLIAAIVYFIRKEQGSFIAYLLPKEIWSHKSTRTDISLLVINRILAALGLFARFGAVPAVAAWVADIMPRPVFAPNALSPLALALIVFTLADFALYWIHRLHHTTRTLWPLHAVHHSASVLTPLTTYRQHPMAGLVSAAMNSVIFGGIIGVLVGTYGTHLTFAEIAGANAFVVLANITITNFQHSHIWISFGPVLERVFISPAQHQVHHSIEPRHFNRNYGQTFAIWDWMFGTLYLIRAREQVTFGLDSEADAPLMTHRLGPMLIDPLRRMFRTAP